MAMREWQSDFLVLGSGIAGLTFALRAARHGTVSIVTKKSDSESNTNYAQGGIAAVLGPDDSLEKHIQDTLTAGAGLCHRDVVETVVRTGPEVIRELVDLGVHFSEAWPGGPFALGQEGGHSARRIVHAHDYTGREVERTLLDAVDRNPRIRVFPHHIAVNLVTRAAGGKPPPEHDAENRCWGAYVLDTASGEVHTVAAAVTLLATGGAGKVYLYTSNPDVATGDGVAMAWRAGARVANLEFFQFHPTCLFHPKAKSFLISEAVRGEGAVLTTIDGATFMERYHPLQSLAPRDVVARAIDQEMKKRGDRYVLLDARAIGAERLRERFPTIDARCRSLGIDITREPIPVVPAAHYLCGGVLAGIDGRTDLPGLLAAGEVACTGLHGANRLASNSLLEALVAARLSVDTAVAERGSAGVLPSIPPWDPGGATAPREAVVLEHTWNEVRELMWDYVGIVRTTERLEAAARKIAVLREEIEGYYWRYTLSADLIELRNIAQVAELIIRCALDRRESRGLHYTLDFPEPDPRLAGVDTVLAPRAFALERAAG
jgi:L-aspartate oxidase